MYLDPSETQFSKMEPDEEPGTLTVSGVMHDGFDLSWNLTAHSIYDSFTVEYTDIRQLWDMREVPLLGDVTATSIRGLKALTEYQIKLYGEIQNQRSALLEAVAVTGITAFFRIRDAQCSFLHFKSLKFYFFSPTFQQLQDTLDSKKTVFITLFVTF